MRKKQGLNPFGGIIRHYQASSYIVGNKGHFYPVDQYVDERKSWTLLKITLKLIIKVNIQGGWIFFTLLFSSHMLSGSDLFLNVYLTLNSNRPLTAESS